MENLPSLSTRRLNYCRHRAAGHPKSTAYRLSGYACKSVEDAASAACKLEKDFRVITMIESLRNSSFTKDCLTLQEKRSFLASVLRTPISEVSSNSPLCQEYSEESTEHGVKRKIRIPDKLRALELDAKLANEFEQDRVTTNPFLFLVTAFKESQPALQEAQGNVIEAETLPA